MKIKKESVEISQEDYERHGTAILKDAVATFHDTFKDRAYVITVSPKRFKRQET